MGLLTPTTDSPPSSPPPIPWMLFLTPLEFAQVVWRGMWQLWENAREVIVKMEKTNIMTNTWERQRQNSLSSLETFFSSGSGYGGQSLEGISDPGCDPSVPFDQVTA